MVPIQLLYPGIRKREKCDIGLSNDAVSGDIR